MTLGSAEVVGPVDHALDALVTAVDHLVKVVDDGGLDGYDDAQLLGFLQDFERVRNRLPVGDHRTIGVVERRGVPAAVTQPSVGRLLVHLLRLAPAEAARRVAAAHACQEQTTMAGEVLAPARPVVAAAQRVGGVSPDQVHIIVRALEKLSGRGFDPAHVDAGERLLTGFAATFAGPDLKRLADQTVDAINPDGTIADAQLQRDRRHLTMRPMADGTYAGEFRLTGPAGAKLTALLQPLTRPRLDPPAAGATTPPELVEGPSTGSGSVDGPSTGSGSVDQRTYGQRSHDALEEVCDRLLRAGTSVGTGGTPATVIVTITAEDLIERLGYGTTTDGTLLTAADVIRLAAEADIIPVVLNRTGAVLTAGRTRRIATPAQTHALIARDGGCSFPGCQRPPEWCQRHHIVAWIDGGTTDLNNLTLLCAYHHHNFTTGGWTCTLNPDRLPQWTPPRWIDRTQTPQLNNRITARHHHRRRPLKPAETPTAAPPRAETPIPTPSTLGVDRSQLPTPTGAATSTTPGAEQPTRHLTRRTPTRNTEVEAPTAKVDGPMLPRSMWSHQDPQRHQQGDLLSTHKV